MHEAFCFHAQNNEKNKTFGFTQIIIIKRKFMIRKFCVCANSCYLWMVMTLYVTKNDTWSDVNQTKADILEVLMLLFVCVSNAGLNLFLLFVWHAKHLILRGLCDVYHKRFMLHQRTWTTCFSSIGDFRCLSQFMCSCTTTFYMDINLCIIVLTN